jgi:hypothetical protein
VVNAQDPGFSALKVWVDANSDGVTQAGELKGLDALSITDLHLDATRTLAIDNGNLVGLLGCYDSADGSIHKLADVWLATGAAADSPPTGEPVALRTAVSDLTASLGRFTEQLDSSLNIAGPAVNLPATAEGAILGPLQADLSTAMAAQLAAFVDQNSLHVGSMPPEMSLADWLSKDLTLSQAVVANGSVDPTAGKPPGH